MVGEIVDMFCHEISYRLARAEDHDVSAFCAMYNSFYAKKVNSEYVRWQFFNPSFSSFLCTAVNTDDKPVGFYGVHLLKANQSNVKTAWILDVMLDPAYQDRGIFRNLAKFAEKQIVSFQPSGIFVLANSVGANAHKYGLGWEIINTYFSFVASTDHIDNAGCMNHLEFKPASFFEKSIYETLWQPFQSQLNLCAVKRDDDYLKWRYDSNPRFSYHRVNAFYDNDLYGHMVLKIFANPITAEKFGDIVDIAWRKNNPDYIAEMLIFALQHFRQNAVNSVLIWLQTNTILDEVGKKTGFVQTAQERFFLGKIIDSKYGYLAHAENWFLSLADSEVY